MFIDALHLYDQRVLIFLLPGPEKVISAIRSALVPFSDAAASIIDNRLGLNMLMSWRSLHFLYALRAFKALGMPSCSFSQGQLLPNVPSMPFPVCMMTILIPLSLRSWNETSVV